MKIVAFSINPVFADRVIGGSTKHLQNALIHLGELGHEVILLCTGRPDNQVPFRWHENVEIRPKLPFSQPFPQPYDIAGYQLAYIAQTLGDELRDADRFYMHDGEWLLPFVYDGEIPVIIGLRDNVYPETTVGTFLFEGDVMLAIADYSRQVYLATAGRFMPELEERLVTVSNALDFDRFRPGAVSAELLDMLKINPHQHTIVLHPHRPEPSKGLQQTVAVADRLVHQFGIDNLLVLVPRWFDADLSSDVRDFYASIERDIATRGLRTHFHFHDWIPQRLMPDYYRVGDVTLVLGHFVEAFGNVPYESLACGTPTVVARVGPHRSLLPEALVDKVHFDDNDEAARIAADWLTSKRPVKPETVTYLKQHYNIDQQLQGYADAILTAQRLPKMSKRVPQLTPETLMQLAPWCYVDGQRLFHDYKATFETLPELAELVQHGTFEMGATLYSAEWLADGYIVPVLTQ